MFRPNILLLLYFSLQPIYCPFTHRNSFFILSFIVYLFQSLIFSLFSFFLALFVNYFLNLIAAPNNFIIIIFPCFPPYISSLLKFCCLRPDNAPHVRERQISAKFDILPRRKLENPLQRVPTSRKTSKGRVLSQLMPDICSNKSLGSQYHCWKL